MLPTKDPSNPANHITQLDLFIAQHKGVNFSSALLNAISNSEKLSKQDKDTFKTIWEMATAFENWNHSDLTIGCQITREKLRQSFALSDLSLELIVRLASYEWK